MTWFRMPKLLALAIALMVGLIAALGCGAVATKESPNSAAGISQLNFADPEKLRNHWLKHRAEFEAGLSEAQYLAKARAFFGNSSSEKLLKSRSNGDELHYLPSTNEFGVLSGEDTIRTYFRPSSGRSYWDRQ